MSKYIQLHLLTSYPPSNLNRDDLGRPKTAVMGGKTRLRVSSQSLKRAWRTSPIFFEALKGHIGKRTKMMGVEAYKDLVKRGVNEVKAKEWAAKIAGVFGECEAANKDKPLEELKIKQLAHFSPEEKKSIFDLAERLSRNNAPPTEKDLDLLAKNHTAVDIAMFGRMLAAAPAYNKEAAVQVAHAVTVHEVAVEDDYFTAVDDLNSGGEDQGAGHLGETEFAAGVFYLYVCIDRHLLKENLADDQLADRAIAALIEASAKIAPTGKQNSFASRAYASYIMAERGDQQPRSLSIAFLKPVRGDDVMSVAISELNAKREAIERSYGPCASGFKTMNAVTGEGSLSDIISFVKE